jgi:hypothetical protein
LIMAGVQLEYIQLLPFSPYINRIPSDFNCILWVN